MTESAAEKASRQPPACLGSVRIKNAHVNGDTFVDFTLACRHCGGGEFYLLGYPIIAPNPSPYFGFNPGDILNRPPHVLECAACAKLAPIFDPRVDGYDAANGHSSTYQTGSQGDKIERLFPAPGLVTVGLAYNSDLVELQQIADQLSAAPGDLFDGIDIRLGPEGAPLFFVAYECA